MAVDTLTWGHIADGNDVLCNIQSPKPPFSKSACIMAFELVVGTDYTSGNSIVINLAGIDQIVFAVVTKSTDGTIVESADAANTTIQGRKLTIAASTTNLRVLIITDI